MGAQRPQTQGRFPLRATFHNAWRKALTPQAHTCSSWMKNADVVKKLTSRKIREKYVVLEGSHWVSGRTTLKNANTDFI